MRVAIRSSRQWRSVLLAFAIGLGAGCVGTALVEDGDPNRPGPEEEPFVPPNPGSPDCAAPKDCAGNLGPAGLGCVWGCSAGRCQRVGKCEEQNQQACQTAAQCLNPLPACNGAKWSCESGTCQSGCANGEWPPECAASRVDLPQNDRCTCKCKDCACTELDCSCPLDCYGNPAGCLEDPFFGESGCVESCVPENDLSTEMVCGVACNNIQVNPVVNPNPVPELPSLPTELCGVKNDGADHLVLDLFNDTQPGGKLAYIWIANSVDGTVSKIDTASGVEKARYLTGPSTQTDPSRTTVSLDGDVVVANRARNSAAYASAIRIKADITTCQDKNGNGSIDTSRGPTDVKPWGQDECVVWHHQFPAGTIPRAAAFDYGACADVCGKAKETVWIGLWNAQQVVQLDGATGALLTTIAVTGHNPYGIAFDNSCNLWVVDRDGDSPLPILRIDTKTKQWAAIPPSPTCDNYGIAVDSKSRVWTTGKNGCVSRYDPTASTWKSIQTRGADRQFNRGLASDGKGAMWVSETDFGVHKINEETMQVLADLQLGTPGARNFVGAAVDFQGKAWAVDQTGNKAYKINPADNSSVPINVGRGPYTYSDMTGFQLYNVSHNGFLRTALQACTVGDTWESITFGGNAPAGTSIVIRARAGNTLQEVETRAFATVATIPPDHSPRQLAAALDAVAAGSSKGLVIQFDVALNSDVRGVTPVLDWLKVKNSGCPTSTNVPLKVQ